MLHTLTHSKFKKKYLDLDQNHKWKIAESINAPALMVRILIYIFKNYQGEKAKTSLKAKEPSYANAKQLRRFAENSNSPPKYFPVATST